jgi:predicted nucleic-acid-binding protein
VAVQRALRDLETGSGDFADYLIGHLAREAGCTETVTFDRRLEDSPLFSVLFTA